MTDDKAKETGKAQEVPKLTEQAESKSNFAKAAQGGKGDKGTKAERAKPKKGGKGWLWLLICAALLGGGGAWAWFNWPQVQAVLARHLDFLPGVGADREQAQGATTSHTPTTAPAETTASTPPATGQQPAPQPGGDTGGAAQQQADAALRNQMQQQQRTIAQLQDQLAQLQRSVTAQGNRLGELGNVSRQDWQLAEADYLLRLANQRLLLERDSRAALGLVEEVDEIVRQVDLPDLYGVRQQLARDITALKLVDNVDREGLYLRLRAVEEQLLRTDIQPEFDLATLDATATEPTEEDSSASPWKRSWHHFTQFLHDSIRIRDGNIDPVLLSPQSEARFRQSLRLNMEQAQLALLREDTTVYKDALNRARQLLLEYGIANHQRDVLAQELEELAQQPIEVDLPSLAASQSALRNYIERLHKTDSGAPATDSGMDNTPGSDTQ